MSEETEVRIDKYGEDTTLAEVILEAQKLCLLENVAYDPSSVVVFADYSGHTFIDLVEELREKGEE